MPASGRRLTSRKVVLTAAFLALAAGGTAACDSPSDQESADTTGYQVYDDLSDPVGADGAGTSGSDVSGSVDDGEEATDEVFYCADEDGEVVDEEYCDDDDGSGTYFLWHSAGYARGLPPGSLLDGGDSFPAGDRAARRSFGLPGTGKVGNGTIKTNVVGRSGSTIGGSSGG
ncbi:hypothetical protein KRM28CT15_37850 [Krasilnikovia sp. M28-CT-15]